MLNERVSEITIERPPDPEYQEGCRILESPKAQGGYQRGLKINIGVDNKRQVGVFDLDGTRIELMEFETIDGKPAPSSTFPPPRCRAIFGILSLSN